MPDPTPDGRIPDRKFFFNVLNTLRPEYMRNVIEYANNLRMSAQAESQQKQTIEISDQWWEKLNGIPFVSCKLHFNN